MINNELVNRKAKRGLVDTVTLGNEERFGFLYYYVLKVMYVQESQTGIVLSLRCTTGGYQDLDICAAPVEVQERAYIRMPGFMEEYKKLL